MRKKSAYPYVSELIAYFERTQPNAKSELNFESPYQLLVAVMLSAQCTDKRVNMVTPALFAAYPDALALSRATSDEVFAYVKSVSYPRSKSEHLVAMALQLVQEFGGNVPNTMESLQSLPGVGRKTANVVLAVAFDVPAMPVDTHVFRVANRIGLTNNSKTPLETESILVKLIPKEKLSLAHHWILLHGRYVCTARNPHCDQCGINEWCAQHAKEAQKNAPLTSHCKKESAKLISSLSH